MPICMKTNWKDGNVNLDKKLIPNISVGHIFSTLLVVLNVRPSFMCFFSLSKHLSWQFSTTLLFATDLKAEERSLSSQAAGLKRELQLDTKEIQSLMVDREKVKEGLEVKTRYVANTVVCLIKDRF